MSIYAKKINGKQRAWLKSYEDDTGFEPMHQEDLDSGEMTFKEMARSNLRWFENWSQEVHEGLETKFPQSLYS